MRPRSGCLRHPSLAGAALAQRHSTFRLAVLADELRDVSARLDAFDASDLHVNLRAELPSSVDTLSLRAASLFALLGIAPASDISRTAGASLLARSGNEVRAELRELKTASPDAATRAGRYRLHDLIRRRRRVCVVLPERRGDRAGTGCRGIPPRHRLSPSGRDHHRARRADPDLPGASAGSPVYTGRLRRLRHITPSLSRSVTSRKPRSR
jgi:hypothetical protein